MEYGTREVRQVRAAQNQSLFREINEEVKALNDSFSMLLPIGEWVCECADLTCVERIEMTGAKYEAIRQGPNRFPVIPGHELPEVERVVQGATAISWSRRSAPEPPSHKTTTHANVTERAVIQLGDLPGGTTRGDRAEESLSVFLLDRMEP